MIVRVAGSGNSPHQGVAGFTGIGGSFPVERVAALPWNRWQDWAGIRMLDLAVRGKLVEQGLNDEPASEFFERIAAEKARLVTVGENKKAKPSEPVRSNDIVFAIPSGWIWTRLAEIAVCLDYMRKPINNTEREKRIRGKSEHELYPYFGATQQQGWIDDYIFDEELVLLGEDGVPFFDPFRPKAYLINGKTWVNNHAHVFKGVLVSHPFLAHYLNVFDYSGRVVGATRSKLNQARANDIPVPLPPLAEQHRIVAKVEELMALLDRLEETRTAAETTRNRLTAASLSRLTAPEITPEAFPDHARFALNALPKLTARAGQIESLRRAILDLAVQGKLVEQDLDDETASELVKRIQDARQAAIAEGRIKKPRKLPPLDDCVSDAFLPEGWITARLGEVYDVRDGTHDTPKYVDDGVPLVTSKNLSSGALSLENAKLISVADHTTISKRSKVDQDDVLFAMIGSIGNPVIVDTESEFSIKNVALFKYFGREFSSPKFLRYLLMNAAYEMKDQATGGLQPFVSLGFLRRYSFWLPPLAEQHRIGAKVDELMTLCGRLESALSATDTTRQRLLEALLHEALAGDRQNREAA